MIEINIKDIMKNQNISRYKLQQITNWNYKRINAIYFSKVKYITLEELEILTNILKCEIQDIIKKK